MRYLRRLVCWWRGHNFGGEYGPGESCCRRCRRWYRLPALALALLLAAPLAAQSPGVGYPTPARVCWQNSRVQQCRPEVMIAGSCCSLVNQAVPIDEDPALRLVSIEARYGVTLPLPGGAAWIGATGHSDTWRADTVLRCWWERQTDEHRRAWSGVPTQTEIHDLLGSTPLSSPVWHSCSPPPPPPPPDPCEPCARMEYRQHGCVTCPCPEGVEPGNPPWCAPPPPPPPVECATCCPDCPPAPACEALPGWARRVLINIAKWDAIGSGIRLRRLQEAAAWLMELECVKPGALSTARTELERQ